MRKPVWPAAPEMHYVERFPHDHVHGRTPVSSIMCADASPLGIAQSPARWAFLDTETTGIAGGTGTYAFLIGVGVCESDGFHIHQFFMRDFAEEAQVLDALADLLKNYEVLVTYNGKTFDAPLLETRFRMMRRRVAHESMAHLDLLHAARRLWKLRLKTCRLVELESAVLGYERVGDIPGMLIPSRYYQFLRTGYMNGLQPVFYHNRMDILTLACLTSLVLGVLDTGGDPSRVAAFHPMDLYGLAKWLAHLGRQDAALEVYDRAMLASRDLPEFTIARIRWAMAAIHKRRGDYASALPLWQALGTRDALVEIAKYHEHHARDYAAALVVSRSAGDESRIARLTRKTSRAAAGAQLLRSMNVGGS